MNRTQRILATVLAAQVVLSVAIFWPKSATSSGVEPLFPDLKAEDVVSMTIADADGQVIEVREAAGVWGLPDADNYPAKADEIAGVLGKIEGLNTRRLVTRTDASHKRLQVAASDFVRRIDLETVDGIKYTLYLGSSPSQGASHVRVEGKNEAYLTSGLVSWDVGTTPASWVDTAYYRAEQDELVQVTLENAQGTFAFDRDEEGNWTWAELPGDGELATDKVNTAINRAASITLTRPLGRERMAAYGLDTPNAVVTLKTEDQTVTLLVGAQDANDMSYVVHVSTSPYHVAVAEYGVKALVENGRDDFLRPEATPTPEAQSTAP